VSRGGGGRQRLYEGTPRLGHLQRQVSRQANLLPGAVPALEHGQSPCPRGRIASLPPRGAAARDVSRRRAAAAPGSNTALSSAARCGAEDFVVCGAASISRAWFPETLSVHEERCSVEGVQWRRRRNRDDCFSRRYERPRTDDAFVFTKKRKNE